MLNALRLKISGRSDARQGPRIRIFRSTTLLCGTSAVAIHLLDVSKGGALAHGSSSRMPHEAVWLQLDGLDIRARVAWVRGNRFGLAFGVPLTDAQLSLITVAH